MNPEALDDLRWTEVTPSQELRAYLRERIAHYKVPRTFDFDAELPRTPTGKLAKGSLRGRYV